MCPVTLIVEVTFSGQMRTEIASYFKAREREREKSASLRFVPVGIY